MALILEQIGEAANHIGVRQILLLCDLRHRQMMLDKEYHQFRVRFRQAMVLAESARIVHPQFGMIAAAALGNVMEERRDIKQPRLRKIGHQLAAERIFVRMLGHREPAHVAHYHQDVLIDRINVE